MKTRCLIFAPSMAIAFAFAMAAHAENELRAQYQNALYLENGAGDVAAAARAYESLATDPAAPADLRSRAQWRWALCSERLGHTPAAVERYRNLLAGGEAADATDDEKALREAAARALLRLGEEAARAGDAQQAAALFACVRETRPELFNQIRIEKAAVRRTLRGHVSSWDNRQPINAAIRIRARSRPVFSGPGGDDTRAHTTWRTQTDSEGRFTIELPPGRYEVRAGAPAYERRYTSTLLLDEDAEAPAIEFTLGRITLPSEIRQVQLVGSFLDNWNGTAPLVQVQPGLWEVRRQLPPGRHEYRFHINDEERLITDVQATNFVEDAHEDYNALLRLDREAEITFRFDENDPHFDRRQRPGERDQ